MNTLWIEIIFWIALFIVFYTYLGYGIVLYLLVKVKELFVKPIKRKLPEDSTLPEVTLFILSLIHISTPEWNHAPPFTEKPGIRSTRHPICLF